MSLIDDLNADIQMLIAKHDAMAKQLAVTEANLIERTQQLEEAKALVAPPPVEVVDRQPEIDALSTELEKYKIELQLAVTQRNAAELQQRVTENNLIELRAQHG